jgi:hypothetical protein
MNKIDNTYLSQKEIDYQETKRGSIKMKMLYNLEDDIHNKFKHNNYICKNCSKQFRTCSCIEVCSDNIYNKVDILIAFFDIFLRVENFGVYMKKRQLLQRKYFMENYTEKPIKKIKWKRKKKHY